MKENKPMKTKTNIRLTIVTVLTVCTALLALPKDLYGQIYVTNQSNGTVSEYNLDGTIVNPALISGVGAATGIVVSGGKLWVANGGGIGEYDAITGAPINASLVSGLSDANGLALSGGNLYVSNRNIGTIGEYDATTGATINASLVSLPPHGFTGIAVDGGKLFVANGDNATIGVYDATTGATINASLVSAGSGYPIGVVVSGGNLWVAYYGASKIGEYDATTGTPINSSLVSGLNGSAGLALFGGNLFVVNYNSGVVGEYDASTGATVNASLAFSGATQSYYIAVVQPYTAEVQQPINSDGSSVFSVRRGVVPVKFTLSQGGTQTCALPSATIALTRTSGGTIGSIDESVYVGPADTGSNFRIDSCQYVYNLSSSALGPGTYRVDININGQTVGSGIFGLK